VAGYRVGLRVRAGPAGTGWVANIGAIVPADGACRSPLTLAAFARWRLLLRGHGDTPAEARADLALELAEEARRAAIQRAG
jgi:hypothetical protein